MSSALNRDPGRFDLHGFFPYRINVLASHVSRRLATVYQRRFGISVAEWRVIAHLAHNRRVSVREIHHQVDMDKPTVSRAARRLEGAKLIARAINPSDRRLLELSLTRKGRRLFEEIAPLALAFEKDLLAALSEAERSALDRVLARLLARLDSLPPDVPLGSP